MFARPVSFALVPAAALLLAACPQHVDSSKQEKKAVEITADDPRVTADTADLYPVKDKDQAKDADAPAEPNPGTGVPDETNGVCRLFAPKLPNPECCVQDLGFDVAVVRDACEHTLYLGESHQMTCGYFFATEETTNKPKWLRLSYTLEQDVEGAVKAHDERISLRVAMDPDFHSDPVPGVKGAFWSTHGGLHWAILPGWSKPRQLTWRDDSCSEEGIVKIIQALVATPEIPAETPRTSLIPGAEAPAAPPAEPPTHAG